MNKTIRQKVVDSQVTIAKHLSCATCIIQTFWSENYFRKVIKKKCFILNFEYLVLL